MKNEKPTKTTPEVRSNKLLTPKEFVLLPFVNDIKAYWPEIRPSLVFIADRAESGLITRFVLPQLKGIAPKLRKFINCVDSLLLEVK